MKRKIILLALSFFGMSGALIGCGGQQVKTTPKKKVEVTFPWDEFCNKYMNLEGGLAACKCVVANDYQEAQFAREEAIADARTELARILGTKVKNMVKRYKSRTIAGGKRFMGSTFEDIAKQIAEKYLQGSRPIKFGTFRTDDGKYMVCAVVALQPDAVKEMVKEIAQEAHLNPKDENILYEEFKAWKAEQQLDKETSK